LASIAAKAKMAIAPSALSHLDAAFNLFNGLSENHRTAKILVRLFPAFHLQTLTKDAANPAKTERSRPLCAGRGQLAFPSCWSRPDDYI
jgi:hypothetical protein